MTPLFAFPAANHATALYRDRTQREHIATLFCPVGETYVADQVDGREHAVVRCERGSEWAQTEENI